jgi:hypothetical protein
VSSGQVRANDRSSSISLVDLHSGRTGVSMKRGVARIMLQ